MHQWPRLRSPAATTESTKTAQPVPSTEDLSGNASADDIASLFASVKPSMQKPNSASPAAPAPRPTGTSKAPEGLNEAATNDDIASLFASVKSGINSASPNHEASTVGPTPSSPHSKLPIAEEELGEVATADDIAMLFQTVQQANKNVMAEQDNSTQETAAITSSKSTPVIPVEELSSNASLDDIEALFAAMKK